MHAFFFFKKQNHLCHVYIYMVFLKKNQFPIKNKWMNRINKNFFLESKYYVFIVEEFYANIDEYSFCM